MLTEMHKTKRVASASTFLERYSKEGDNFLRLNMESLLYTAIEVAIHGMAAFNITHEIEVRTTNKFSQENHVYCILG